MSRQLATAQTVSRLARPRPDRLEDEPRRLERNHFLIVDETATCPSDAEPPTCCWFAPVSRRDERRSIIVTSNRGLEQ